MKKIILVLITLCIASTAVWAEFTVETQLRMASYWSLHEDRDFSFKFDDNNNGNMGFHVTGKIADHTTLNMNLKAAGAYDAIGGNSAISIGNIYLESEIWKNAIAYGNEELNDLLSIKLLGGIKSFGPSNNYSFAPNIKYGGAGISQASIGTETGLGFGAKVTLFTLGAGQINGTFGFLIDTGKDGFQQIIGDRQGDSGEDDPAIGTQAPQIYASLGYDLLGVRGSYGYKDFQLFADVMYTNVGGKDIKPGDFITDVGSGSVRNGGNSIGVAVRTNIPVDLVEDDPYTRLSIAGSAAYFTGTSFTEADLVISDATTTALTFNPYYTFGADIGWFMPFSENMVMDVAYGIRGKSAMTYTDLIVSDEVLLEQNTNIDMSAGIMFQFPNLVNGAQIGIVASIENMLNGQSLPNMTSDNLIRGFLNQDPNLILALGGGFMQEVGKAMLTYKAQAGVTNMLSNDLYISTSDDASMVAPDFFGAIGAEMAIGGFKLDVGFVYTPFGGMETMLLDIKTGRDDLDEGSKTGMYLNVSLKL